MRFKKTVLAGFALISAALAPGLAEAANGYATGNVNLRAGPSTDYPVVVTIPAGAPVNIYGCLSGYSWCDVGYAGTRGWVSASYLQASYQSRRVAVPTYATRIGVPVISFSVNNYWDRYYRARPFYRERDRWHRHNVQRPHIQRPQAQRPQVQRPQAQRPPVQRPSAQRPPVRHDARPDRRDSRPNVQHNRPGQNRPGPDRR